MTLNQFLSPSVHAMHVGNAAKKLDLRIDLSVVM